MTSSAERDGNLVLTRLARAAHVVLGGAVGALFGLTLTLAIVVAMARLGWFIFAVHDLAELRRETMPVVFGLVGGAWLAGRRPGAFWQTIVVALGGLALGVGLGVLVAKVAGASSSWVWSAGVLGGVVGAWGLGIRRLLRDEGDRDSPIPARPGGALALGTGSVALVSLIAVAVLGAASSPGEYEDVFEAERFRVPVPNPTDVETVTFLVGDAGATIAGRSPLLEALRHDIERWSDTLARDSAVSVVFLGDLVYPVGVRSRGHGAYARDSARLWNQIELLGGTEARRAGARGWFLAGNHDWGNSSGAVGLARIFNLEAELAQARRLGIGAHLQPPYGGPGPSTVDVGRRLRLVMLDTHWYLQNRAPTATEQFASAVDSALASAGDRHVVLAAHHPYETAGPHGALTPSEYGWGLGLVLKRTGALVQDLSSNVYADLLARLERSFHDAARPPLVFAGGHDHSLQVMRGVSGAEPTFTLVSGAGSKLSPIRGRPEGLEFAASRPGYMMLVGHVDGGVSLFVIAGDPRRLVCPEEEPERRACMVTGENRFDVVFSRVLVPSPTAREVGEAWNVPSGTGFAWWVERIADSIPAVREEGDEEEVRVAPPVAVPMRKLLFDPDSVSATPGEDYDVGAVERALAGDLNRRLWHTPIRLPVVDLDTLGGGVTVDELTGGLQTFGVRLEAENGTKYQFRSIVKNGRSTVPEPLRVADGLVELVDDQMAAQFPLAAMVVAELLEAAGAHVARPVPVVLPNSDRLGEYRALLAGRVGWLEVWPDERDEDRPGFAGSAKIVDGETIFEKLRESPGHYVAAEEFLKVRLLDIFVGDWDRHPGQWRWASFEDGERVRWEPISRDRDWAFVRSDGLPSLLSGLFLPRYVGFDAQYPPIDRLVRTGTPLDTLLLADLEVADFRRIATNLTQKLSDDRLERAIDVLPPTHREVAGRRLLAALQSRRDALVRVAEEFHRYIRATLGE